MNKLNRYYISQNISIDNALSMNQILHQIVNEIKGIVDFINNLELRANEYTDEQIRLLNERLQAQLETLEQTLKTYTNDKINEYDVEVINPQLTEIRNTIDTINRTLNARIDNEVGILNRRIDSEVSTLNRIIEDTKTYLEDLIKKGMSYVYSSISGLHLPLQDVLGEIGNVLKQSLSYNWNSIDEFKTIDKSFSANANVYNVDVTLFGYATKLTKGINLEEVDEETIEGRTGKWLHFEFDTPSLFDSLNIGDTMMVDYGHGENSNEVAVTSNYTFIMKTSNTTAVAQLHSLSGTNTYAFVGLDKQVGSSPPFTYETIFDDLSKVTISYNNDFVAKNITFNSIKLAMQELNVNYNSLAYTGVNTFYELNETEKLFDTDGVKSDYFTGNKYKVIHNNFDSDFFAYEEEENNENEGE